MEPTGVSVIRSIVCSTPNVRAAARQRGAGAPLGFIVAPFHAAYTHSGWRAVPAAHSTRVNIDNDGQYAR